MNRNTAFTLVIVGSMAAVAAMVIGACPARSAEFRCIPAGVIDGDTIRVPTDCLPEPQLTSIRIRGIDTPEIHGKCPEEIDLARRARDLTRALVADAAEVLIVNPTRDKYGNRRVADVVLVMPPASSSGAAGVPLGTPGAPSIRISLAQSLLAAGLAGRYSGRGPKPVWCPAQ